MPYMEHMEDGAAETNWMLDGELKAVIGLKRNGNMYQIFYNGATNQLRSTELAQHIFKVAAANHHPKYGRERLWKSLGDPVVHTVLAEDFFVVPMQLDLGWRLEIRTAIFNMTPKIRLNCILKHVIMYVYILYIIYIYIYPHKMANSSCPAFFPWSHCCHPAVTSRGLVQRQGTSLLQLTFGPDLWLVNDHSPPFLKIVLVCFSYGKIL